MTKVIPIKLDDNTVIYIEATEDVNIPLVNTVVLDEEGVKTRYAQNLSPCKVFVTNSTRSPLSI